MMTDRDAATLEREIDEQTGLVQGLRMSVYSQHDPTANAGLFSQLTEAEAKLDDLRQQLAAVKGETAEGEKPETRDSAPRGHFLSAKTTGLRVDFKLRIDPLPTGAYHVMDPRTEPLLTVEVENVSREIRRVCVKAYLEGLSATAVRTIEIEPKKTAAFNLQPTLFPERVQAITEVHRATLHVLVEDLDGKLESHDTYPITCLAVHSQLQRGSPA